MSWVRERAHSKKEFEPHLGDVPDWTPPAVLVRKVRQRRDWVQFFTITVVGWVAMIVYAVVVIAWITAIVMLTAKPANAQALDYSCADVREFVRTQSRLTVALARSRMTKDQLRAAEACLNRTVRKRKIKH